MITDMTSCRQQGGRAVFLDRDGTINEEVSYLSRVEDIRLVPGASEGIKRLARSGFRIVVVTNQSGVARGYFDEERVMEINSALASMLAEQGAPVHGWYFCPHHPDAAVERYRLECHCRKPAPGLIEQAAGEMAIDCQESFMIGDAIRDVEAGIRAGCRSVLVRTGHGMEACRDGKLLRLAGEHNIHVAEDLNAASLWILGQEGG
jgi:D-glycero-D-manno-heptose 1,7-bisphosphate phosphatase